MGIEAPEKISELENYVENLSRLVEINGIINSTLNINRLLSIIMETIKSIMNTGASSLLLFDEESQELVFKVALGEAGGELQEKYRVKIGQGIAGYVAETRKSLVVNDVYSDSRFDSMFDQNTGFVTRSIICAPLLFKGKLLGVIQGINPLNRNGFNENDEHLFRLFSNQAALAVQNAIFFQKAIEEERIVSELKSAREIQKSLTPDVDYNAGNFSFSARSFSARELGGGFHFFKSCHDDCCVFALGSLGEKGIPGAMKAVAVSAMLGSLIDYNTRDLVVMVDKIRSIVSGSLRAAGRVSAFLGFLDVERSELNFINAGKACPLLIRDGNISFLRFSSKSNGYICDDDFFASPVRISMKNGDRVIVISESLFEVKNRKGRVLSLSSVVKHLGRNIDSPGNMIASLLNYIDEFTEGLERSHDISVLSLEVK